MTYDTLKKLHVLYWSQKHGAFTYETVGEMLQANWDTYFQRKLDDSDRIVMGIADNLDAIRTLHNSLVEKFAVGNPGPFHPPHL